MKKNDVKKVLGKLKSNYRKSFSGMSSEEANDYLDIWTDGLSRISDEYIWQALDYFMFETTDSFAPTIGQFLAKADEFRIEYERQHPVITNAWENHDDRIG